MADERKPISVSDQLEALVRISAANVAALETALQIAASDYIIATRSSPRIREALVARWRDGKSAKP